MNETKCKDVYYLKDICCVCGRSKKCTILKEFQREVLGVYKLINPTQVLLNEIKNNKLKKKDIAKTYTLAMMSGEATDWGVINEAIITRWSLSALRDIKKMAWMGR